MNLLTLASKGRLIHQLNLLKIRMKNRHQDKASNSLLDSNVPGVPVAIFTMLLNLFLGPVLAFALIAAGVFLQGYLSWIAFFAAASVYVAWGFFMVRNSQSVEDGLGYVHLRGKSASNSSSYLTR